MLVVVIVALEVGTGMVNVSGVGIIIIGCGHGEHVTLANASENVRSNRRSKLTDRPTDVESLEPTNK